MFILQIQKSHSASFIYFELLQVSAMVQASQGGSTCSQKKKKELKSRKNVSLSSNKRMCFDTLSDELSMQTSRLQRLVGYITYGFFESNKNRENQKVHPTQKKKKNNQRIQLQSVTSFSPFPFPVLLHRPGKEASRCPRWSSSETRNRCSPLSEEAFPLNKYDGVYPSETFQPVNARCSFAGTAFLFVPWPRWVAVITVARSHS